MPIAHITNELSQFTIPLNLIAPTGKSLGIATVFIYDYEEYYYLITNGHVVTGFNYEDNIRISKNAAFPVEIKMKFLNKIHVENPDYSEETLEAFGRNNIDKTKVVPLFPIAEYTYALYQENKSEEYITPDWYIHPELGYKIDVIAIPLWPRKEVPIGTVLFALNAYLRSEERLRVTDEVYILGYPFGITNELQTPIWKRGSIASEPNINYKDLPRFLIDTATRSGMSGAPVVLVRPGMNAKDFVFIGVYSGIIGEETNAQLGIVWKKEVIEEVIRGKVLGTTEFQFK